MITNDDCMLLMGPDSSYDYYLTVPKNGEIEKIGYFNSNDKWVFVDYKGIEGWVYSDNFLS